MCYILGGGIVYLCMWRSMFGVNRGCIALPARTRRIYEGSLHLEYFASRGYFVQDCVYFR